MAGQGGGAGHQSMPPHLSETHELLLRGYMTAGGNDWNWEGADEAGSNVPYADDNTYEDNPSALRFIYEKGLTDAGGNPYEGVSGYDPEDDLEVMQTELETFQTAVGSYDPDADVLSHLSQALTAAQAGITDMDLTAVAEDVASYARRIGSVGIADALSEASNSVKQTVVRTAVDEFVKRQERDHLKQLNRFTGPMRDINAVNSSAFMMGLAFLEAEMADRVAEFEANVSIQVTQQAVQQFTQVFVEVLTRYLTLQYQERLQEQQHRLQYTLEGARLIQAETDLDARMQQSVASLQAEINRIRLVAINEQYDRNIEYDVKAANWDLEIFQQGANIMSAGSGSVVPQAGKPSKAQSALGGALAGASVAAMTGNPYLIAGAALAGGIGGLLSN